MYIAYIYRTNKRTQGQECRDIKGERLKDVMAQINELRDNNELDKYSPYRIGNVINTEEE